MYLLGWQSVLCNILSSFCYIQSYLKQITCMWFYKRHMLASSHWGWRQRQSVLYYNWQHSHILHIRNQSRSKKSFVPYNIINREQKLGNNFVCPLLINPNDFVPYLLSIGTQTTIKLATHYYPLLDCTWYWASFFTYFCVHSIVKFRDQLTSYKNDLSLKD